MSLHAFLSDRTLIDPTKRTINLETMNVPCGYLDREIIEHFVEPLELLDFRTSRLPIIYRSEITGPINDQFFEDDILNRIVPIGEAHLTNSPNETVTLAEYPYLDIAPFFDDILPVGPISANRCLEFKLTLDSLKMTTAEKNAIASATQTELDNLMNVIEYLAYGTIRSDSLSKINDDLVGPVDFIGYVPNTISMHDEKCVSYLFSGINIHRFVPKKFTFKFILGADTIEITVWFNRKLFRETYPISTIIKVIPPLDPQTLLDPTNLTDPLLAAARSREVNDAVMNKEITDNDQSGSMTFTTRYVFNAQTHMLSFNIIYRGRKPDEIESRKAIADYLLDTGIGTRAIWESRFPDIFLINVFYIVPMYNETTELTNADIYSSIISLGEITSNYNKVIAGIEHNSNVFEIMTVAYDKLFLAVTSDPTNEIASLLQAHPTYRDFSTTDIGFGEMSSNDREWAVLINHVLSIASGQVNNTNYGIIHEGGKEFVSLIRNHNAYNIMTKESYMQAIA